MTAYEHKQPGKLIRWTMILTIVAFVVIMTVAKIWTYPIAVQLIPIVVLLILLACAILFDSLTVRITESRLSFHFGPGLIRRSFELKEIEEAEIVRNQWWYGWGIRLTPHGWMYNVSGMDAVQITLRGGKKFRIGTDQPLELHSAIQAAMR
jgi:hypothetical protein